MFFLEKTFSSQNRMRLTRGKKVQQPKRYGFDSVKSGLLAYLKSIDLGQPAQSANGSNPFAIG